MNIMLLVPAIALVINGVLLIYTVLRHNHTSLHNSFLLLITFSELGILVTFLLKAQYAVLSSGWLLQLLRFNLIFWLSSGFLFLSFVYELTNRKRDNTYYFSLASLVTSLIIGLSSSWIIESYSLYPWGVAVKHGQLFLPIILVVLLFPIFYSLFLIHRDLDLAKTSNRRAQLRLMFWGAIAATAIASLIAFALPEHWRIRGIIQVSEASVILTLCLFWAIIRYRFMTIGIENIADDLFMHIQNGVMIINNDNVIIQTNQMALSMLGCGESDILYKNVDNVLPGCSQIDHDQTNHEIAYFVDGQKKIFYASLVTVNQKTKCIGKILILHDITKNKAAEDALRESEERLHRIIDNAYDGINIVEFNQTTHARRLVMCNESYLRMSGYTREELMAVDDLDKLSKVQYIDDTVARKNWTLQEIREKKPVFRGVSSWSRPDGKENLYEWTASPWVVGEKLYFVGIDRDITERKKIERELRASEERYKRLVENCPDAILVYRRGTVLYANAAAAKLFAAKTPSELENCLASKLIHTDHLDNIRKIFAQMESMDAFDAYQFSEALIETELLRFDGETVIAELSPMPIQYQGQSAVLIVARDVSQRKYAEKALEEINERYRTLVDLSPEAIIVYSRMDGQLLFVNSQGARMLGVSYDEVKRRKIMELVHPDSLSQVKQWEERLSHSQQVSFAEIKFMRADGTEINNIEAAAVFAKFEGKPATFVMIRDITERKLTETALKENEEKYRMLFDYSPEAIFLIEIRHNGDQWPIVDCNAAAGSMNGYEPQELIGRPINLLLPQEQSFEEQQEYYRRLKERKYVSEVVAHKKKDGSIFYIETSGYLITIGDQEMLLGIDHDITERLQAEQALRDNEERYRTLFDRSHDGIFLFVPHEDDDEWTIIDCNEAACKMNGYNRDELIGKSINIVNRDKISVEGFQELLTNLRKAKKVSGEVWHRRKDGTEFPIETITNLLVINGKEVILGIDRDISDRKKAEETIHHQMYYDTLTGLPNRTLFNDRLILALANSHRTGSVLAVVFLNLDRFKIINDTLGHTVGDQLLVSVAERISACLGEGDTLARLSGDTFTLLLPQVQRVDDIAKIAQSIMERFVQPFILSDMEIYTTLSIGIALYPNDGEDADTLMKNADTALSRAKEQGRNNYQFYTPLMNAKASQRLALENSLRRALSREEFIVYYQPQIEAESRRIVGAEVLIRWMHPDLGLVSPAEFIPMAEETGLIIPIGEWVLRTACLQSKAWQRNGLPAIRVAINLSARQFQQRDLVNMVRETLRETDFDPKLLELEITESIAMQNADYSIAVLNDFKAMGVHISLDDFGTGYSSLNYLKRFPIDTLKIDQSFVRELTINPNDFAIAKAVIALAHSLNLEVMAEGVETEEQMALLKAEQCDMMQGYLFGHPIPVSEFEAMLMHPNLK